MSNDGGLRVRFANAVDGRTLTELGVASTPDRFFTLRRADTVASIRAAYRARAEDSRATTAGLALDDVVDGSRGERTVWAPCT